MYLKNDIDWDFSIFLSRISLESSKISGSLDKFIDCLEGIKEKANKPAEGEVISEMEIPDELGKAFVEAINDLQNEVFYNSLFIITTSFLEYSLTELCRIIGPYLKGAPYQYFQYKKGNGIEKARNYLAEIMGIDISNKKHWSDFQMNSKIRNVIIHNAGNIIKDYEKGIEDQNDFKAFKSNENIRISETGYLFIKNSEFIRDTHRKEADFIRDVYAEVIEKLKEKEPKEAKPSNPDSSQCNA